LYEMVTGRRAFQRASAPQTLTAIIQDEPEPIAGLNPKIPAPVRWIVERCLAKEARNRYSSTEDLARELATVRDHLSEATSAVGVPSERPARGSRRRWWIPAAISAAVLVAAVLTAWRLRQRDYFWKNPVAGARYTRFTDWEGSELDAAISPDGKFVAFLSDRDGPFDAWVTQVGSGEFRNLSKGQFQDLLNIFHRNIGFSDDAAHVWLRVSGKSGRSQTLWLAPTMGGALRPFLPNAVQVVWSPDRSRILYHTPDPGDPIFIAERNGGNPRQIFRSKPGIHNHFPTWSPDGRFVYFVRGEPATNEWDIWRLPSAGGVAERLTHHHSGVGYPTLLDERTLVYVATREDGSGSGLYGLDVNRRILHPLASGLEEYRSVASSADGLRLVATVANPVHNIWAAPISDHVVDDADVTRFNLPTVRAAAPRYGPDYLLYLSAKGGADGLWKYKDGSETELWKGSEGAVTVAPAISPDGTQVAFAVHGERQAHLCLMAADGTGVHRLAESLDVNDAPSWSPDGRWIAVVANDDMKANPLYKVPVDGGPPIRLVEGVTHDPVWSPDGRFILYSEALGSAVHRLRGVTPDKRPFPLPEVWVRYAGNRYRFLPGGKAVIVMQGEGWRQNFWMLDLTTEHLRQLTNLRPGFDMRSFDVSPDGKQILFDRYRENSDIVLIDLPPR
ncbi:MAG TPA: hypothetical protein VK389_07785, partial [Thermoanaerobaculia bacterium]|nr:hypothetical protein [Thermoanaerobaculia bacterium]